ncbi:hypothetical protein NHX12_008122, partial [Muraenolepis orangiensis]
MPTFRYFTWHTCGLGIMGCVIMMFLINAIYASASIAFMLLLLLLLIHYLRPTSSWGYVSQVLIFHQRKKTSSRQTSYNPNHKGPGELQSGSSGCDHGSEGRGDNSLVRKYLLMLDVRKDHVKFWGPQMLLVVTNPCSSVSLVSFINEEEERPLRAGTRAAGGA